MFEVFTPEIEQLIKDGIANLYWYKDDLKKAWIIAGVDPTLANALRYKKNKEGREYTKRELMGVLYDYIRKMDYNRRLEISRNFVRFLIEQKDFSPIKPEHRIDVAERSALKLREIINIQKEDREKRDFNLKKHEPDRKSKYLHNIEQIKRQFEDCNGLSPQKRGYEFEKIFQNLAKINDITVTKPFKIEGEQIDGAIKFEGHYYLIELRWRDKKANQADIASLFLKAEGKGETRGIFISMKGFSPEVLNSLPTGKNLRVILMDGNHIANAIYDAYGLFSFKKLLEHAIENLSLKGKIYCPHNID